VVRRALLIAVLGACSDDTVPVPDEPVPVGACDGLLTYVRGEAGTHVPFASVIEWSTNPPVTGSHYPSWAGWDRHYQQLDRGFYVHNAEHGGIVLLYNCPTGCQDVVDALLDVTRNATPDGTCADPIRHRILVAADPLLPPEIQVAAVAWNRLYTASCFDPYVATFTREQYAHAPEDFCADGNPMTGVPIR
jgi:hypothetical protein